MIRFFLLLGAVLLLPELAHAQQFPADILNGPINGSVAAWIIRTFGLLTVLSVAPGILIMVTSFPRFVIAFSILRSGMGIASAPNNMILLSMALFMTFYVMSPTMDKSWQDGVKPLLDNQITEQEAFTRIADPFRDFMMTQVRPTDLALFNSLSEASQRDRVATPPPPAADGTAETEVVDLRVLIPAFMISELRRGFEIGFLIVLPFLVIDLIVATLTMSMGMMMLPPTVISLPFKILFFVLIDGWNMLTGSLVRSFF